MISASFNVSITRNVMSARLPIGVAHKNNTPAMTFHRLSPKLRPPP
jgi:hypothetical protein